MVSESFALGGRPPVRRLGYGTAQLTGPGYWGPRGDARDAVAVLRRAVGRGVTLVDTADNYGPSIAEELVAEALYQLHRLDPAVPMAEQLGALDELRAEGKIRHIGLDSVSAEQLEEAMELTDIASVQNRFNLLDRDSEPLLKLCEARGIAFLPWFPLGNGSLTADPACARIAAAHGATPGQIALAWLLHRSPVLCPTPGTGSLAHLEENLDAGAVRLTAEDMAALG
ncbi:aldo/keto reductase [Streptomyces mirabilis]|uniref:aldo/keto reductase n=1 Tax=Streptomyces mirabilis TaxID=68239 RepID=UPI00367528D4